MTDIGGKVPGSHADRCHARSSRRASRSRRSRSTRRACCSEDLLKLVLHQCRLPHWNRADFNAIVAACRTGRAARASRCATASATISSSRRIEAAARAQQARDDAADPTAIPEKNPYFEDYVCDDGTRLRPLQDRAARCGARATSVILDFDRHRSAVAKPRSTSTSTKTCSRCSSAST